MRAAETEVQSSAPTLAQALLKSAEASRNAANRQSYTSRTSIQSINLNTTVSHVTTDGNTTNQHGNEQGHGDTVRDDHHDAGSVGDAQGAGEPSTESDLRNLASSSTTGGVVSGSARKPVKPRARPRKPQSVETPFDQLPAESDPASSTSRTASTAAPDTNASTTPDTMERSRSKTVRNAARGIETNPQGEGDTDPLYTPASRVVADTTSASASSSAAVIEDSVVRNALLADMRTGLSDSSAAQKQTMETGLSEARQRSRQNRKAQRMRAPTANDEEEEPVGERQGVNVPGSATAAETAEDLRAAGLQKAPKTGKQFKPNSVRRRKQGDATASNQDQAVTQEGRAAAHTSAKPQPTRRRKKQPIMEDTIQDLDGEGNEVQTSQAAVETGAATSSSTLSGRKDKRKRARKEAQHPEADTEHVSGPSNEDADNSNQSNRTSAEDAAEDEDLGPPRKKGGRRRQETPEDAETHTIDPKTMTMAELCKDRKRGKKSKLETEMQTIDWDAVAERRKEAENRARAAARIAGKKAGNVSRTEARRQLNEAGKEAETGAEVDADANADDPDYEGPQLVMGAEGDLVVDQTSLVVKRHAPIVETQDAVEENDLTKRVNSHAWLYDSRRDPNDRFFNHSTKWTADETNVFYGALKMFGTDFDMISKMFPGRNRRMIKLKFSREERDNEWRIRAVLLGQPDPINFENYCNFTGQNASDFKDPEVFKEELKREEETLVASLEKDRRDMAERQKKKQAAALQKADMARRRKNGEKVTRRRRKQIVDPPANGEATGDADAGAIEITEGGAGKRRKPASKPRPRRKNIPGRPADAQDGQSTGAAADAPVEDAVANEVQDTNATDAEGQGDDTNNNDNPYDDGDEGMGNDHDPDEPVASIE